MSSSRWIAILTGIWVALIAAGFLHSGLTDPTGTGFGRGWNILIVFAAWQLAAILMGFAILVFWLVQRRALVPWVKVAGLIAPTVSLGAVVIVAIWIAVA